MLNQNKKIKNILVIDDSIIVQFKNGSKREFLISEVVKIHLTINKKSNLISTIVFAIALLIMFIALDKNLLFIIAILYLIFIYFILRNDKIFRFKYILTIQKSNSNTYRFRFEYHLKDKIIDVISSVKKIIKQ